MLFQILSQPVTADETAEIWRKIQKGIQVLGITVQPSSLHKLSFLSSVLDKPFTIHSLADSLPPSIKYSINQ